MKKITAVICAAAMALSAVSVLAEDDGREYTTEGGYFFEYEYGKKWYHNTDGTTYRYSANTDEGYVTLILRDVKQSDITVPSSVNGVPVKAVSSDKVGKAKLKSIVFPDTVTTIDGFDGYENLKHLTLPKNMAGIERYSFTDCVSLESIDIPDSVTKIGEHAFSGCAALKKVDLNEGLLSIGEYAFSKTGIEAVRLPSTLERLNEGCFKDTEALKSVAIPENVKRIEDRAFCGSGIKSLTLMCKMEYIGNNAFAQTPLEEVSGLSRDDMIMFWNAFSGTPWQESMVDENEPFLIDKNGRLVAYVGKSMDISIPETVKTIGGSAFTGKAITSVDIPNTAAEIEDNAFYGCDKLTSVIIPASVNKIGQMAFSNCYKLKDITFEYSSETLSLGSSAFQFTLASPETLVTNNRRYTNQKTAFQNTYFDADYVPVSVNDTPQSNSEPPKMTEAPKETEKPTASPEATNKPNGITEPAEQPGTIDVSSGDKITVEVNGKAVTFPDAEPYIDENGRTQIPIRAVAEALGCEVKWDSITRTAEITKSDIIISIGIGKNIMQVGREVVEMDTAAEIVDDRTYIPVRFVGEALGMKVNWVSR